MTTCQNCGASLDDDPSFCPSCGSALDGGQTAAGQDAAGQPTGGQSAGTQAAGQPAGGQPPQGQQPPADGGMSRRKLLGIGGGAAALVAAAGGGWFLLQSGGSQYGQTFEGRIQTGGPRDPIYNDLCATHTFRGAAGDMVEITMQSEAFDPYVILTDGNGGTIAEKDDGGQSFNTRMVTTLPRDTQYKVWAGSLSGEATGPYTLTIEKAEAGAQPNTF